MLLSSESMEFHLTTDQTRKFYEWSKRIDPVYSGAIGGMFTFSFTPTSLGMVIKVKHFKGHELDLTEYDNM